MPEGYGGIRMKFTVNGFSQKKAVEMGLSAEDLLILRWFVDFQGSDKMIKFTTEDGSYAWVDYKHFLEDMPIVKCNKKNLATKFQRLVDAGILKHKTIKQGGTFSAYCFGSAYDGLISSDGVQSSAGGVPKSGNPIPESGTPVDRNQETPLPENDPTKINLLNNQSTKDKEVEDKSSRSRTSPIPYEKVASLYSTICTSYSKLAKLSDARKKAIHARFNSGYELDDFKRLFEMAEESSFLKGKNDRHWHATFDWLIKDTNMAKVLEENYADNKNKLKADSQVSSSNPWGGVR